MSATATSVAVTESHTPDIPQKYAIRNAAGTMKTSPRRRDVTWDGMGLSMEVKKTDKIMLNPVKNMDVKYSFSPMGASRESSAFPSLLNMSVMGDANTNTEA